MSEEYPKPAEPEHERQYQKPAWIGGAILILIGVIFLALNVTGFTLENWWALFLLIPAITSFGRATSIYQAEGRLTRPARGAMLGGLVLTFLAAVFLFNLDFGTLWPVFLILGGIGLLLNSILPG